MRIFEHAAGQSLHTALAVLSVTLMVSVTFAVMVSDDSVADEAPDYNAFYYSQADNFANPDVIRYAYGLFAAIDVPFGEAVEVTVPLGTHSGQEIVDACYMARMFFTHDHPECFWISENTSMDPDYNSAETEVVFTLQPVEYTGLSITDAVGGQNALNQIDAIIDNWGISKLDTPLMTIEKINDGISGLFNHGTAGTLGSELRNIITPFLSTEHKAVCAGYAPAFKYCCDKYRIPCITVSGLYDDKADFDEKDSHMWCNVKLGDDWYLVDPLHNDNDRNNKSKLLLGSDHTSTYRATIYTMMKEDQVDYPVLSTQSYYQYTIKFVDWDDRVISEKVCLPGELYEVAEGPIREGYHFRGWLGLKAANYHYAEKSETFKANYYGGPNGSGGTGSSDSTENQSICASSVALILVAAMSVAAIPVIRFLRP